MPCCEVPQEPRKCWELLRSVFGTSGWGLARPEGGYLSSDEYDSSFFISFESDCWVWPQQWIYVNVLVWFGSHDHHFKTAHKLKSVGNESNDSMVILMICLLVNLQVFFRHQTDFASHLGLCFLYKVTLLPFLWTLLAYFYFACILLLCF